MFPLPNLPSDHALGKVRVPCSERRQQSRLSVRNPTFELRRWPANAVECGAPRTHLSGCPECRRKEPVGKGIDHQSGGHPQHSIDRILRDPVVPPRDFIHVVVQMLGAHAVIGALGAVLQQGPERLRPIGMRLLADIRPGGMLNRLVPELRHPGIGRRLITAQLRLGYPAVLHEDCSAGLVVRRSGAAWTRLVRRSRAPAPGSLLQC